MRRSPKLEGVMLGDQPGLRNAVARQATDLAAGRTWTRVDPSDLSRFAAVGVPADYRARVSADLAAGYVVIAPAQPEATAPDALAWWRIEPRNGTALGMLSSGGGAVLVEWGDLIQGFVGAACGVWMMGSTIGAVEGVAAGVGFAACIAAGPFGAAYGLPGLLFGSGVGVAGVAALLLGVI